MNDAATNHANSVVKMTGLDVDIVSTSNQGTLILNTGASIKTTGGDTNIGVEITTTDGAGPDLKIMSSADADDYFSIATTAAGATTFTTVDDGGAEADIIFAPDGIIRVNDNTKLAFGTEEDASIEYDEDGIDQLNISGSQAGILLYAPLITASIETGFAIKNSIEGGTAQLQLIADQGDDAEDAATITKANNGALTIASHIGEIVLDSNNDITLDPGTSGNEYIHIKADGTLRGVITTDTANELKFLDKDEEHVFSLQVDAMEMQDDKKLQFGSSGESAIWYRETSDNLMVISGSAIGTVVSGSKFIVDAQSDVTVGTTAGSMTVGAALADGQTLKLGKNGAVETIIAPHGTAGSELYSVINTAGDTDGSDAAGAVLLSSVAGGIGLAWNDGKDLWAEGGRAVITANEDAADCIKLHADAGTSQTITVVNDAGTGAAAIGLTSTAGGISLTAGAVNTVHDFATTAPLSMGLFDADGERSGTVIKLSPGADDTLTLGQLYFLHTDGTWNATDADAVATGASQMLGIGLGNARSVGVFIKGFIRIPSTEILNVPGSNASPGLPIYVSTTAGHLDFTAPSASGDFVRIVGYAIQDSTDVLIYFNPDSTWVEIS